MFSFWSNDEDDENSDHDEDIEESEVEKNKKPERFRYQVKKIERNAMTEDNVFQENRNAKMCNEKLKQMDDMLQDVWSVRRDVRVHDAKKATDYGQKSFYSRHAGASGNGTQPESNQTKTILSGKTSSTKTWSVPRTGFSYSDHKTDRQIDILDENVIGNVVSSIPSENPKSDIQRQNIVNSLQHGPNVTTRELSARTRRAQTFNNAYLRSSGLGKFTPGSSSPLNSHNGGKNWTS